MIDYPAAHSMDTNWFAVDANGNIGVFDSSEGGAVPKSNSQARHRARENWNIDGDFDYLEEFLTIWAEEDSDRIIRLDIPSESILSNLSVEVKEIPSHSITTPELPSKSIFLELFKSPVCRQFEREWCNEEDSHWLLIPSVKETDLWAILKNEELHYPDCEYTIRFSGEIPLLLVTGRSLVTIQSAISLGLLKYIIHLEGHISLLATLVGMFYYRVDCQSPYPYEVSGKPFYPLKLQDLPLKFQNFLTANKFDTLKFSETQKIQPIEHMPCNTWSDDKWWVDTQGNERWGHPEYPLKS